MLYKLEKKIILSTLTFFFFQFYKCKNQIIGKTHEDTVQQEKKFSAELEIKNSLGLHARPAALFVQISSMYESDVIVEKDGETVNGKSLMGLLMLAAGYGSKIKITVVGDDAESAFLALVNLIDSKFQEE